jgi:UDP-N-acetylglucosamine 1-carboxyvinyltransferase
MARFHISGSAELRGTIEVAANKNAILPMMAATLLTNQDSIIHNVPQIADVAVMANLLRSVGGSVEYLDPRTLKINTSLVDEWEPAQEHAARMRASVLLAGPLLARFKRWSMQHPGGDAIGTRSIQTHLEAFKRLGAQATSSKGYYSVSFDTMRAGEIFLDEASVTATENIMLIASRIHGTTTIRNAACEPHVENLAVMLQGMGAEVEGAGTNLLRITGCQDLNGASCDVWPDHTEAGTFAALSAAAGGDVRIENVRRPHLENLLIVFERMGVNFEFDGNAMLVHPSELTCTSQIVTGPWPSFPTDLASVFIVLATQARGMTLVHDWMYESRMYFVDRLKEMGAAIVLADPHRCVISGKSELHGRDFVSPDIRAGIALVIASMVAKGDSTIDHVELIDRGYERIDERLRGLGAEIFREGEPVVPVAVA